MQALLDDLDDIQRIHVLNAVNPGFPEQLNHSKYKEHLSVARCFKQFLLIPQKNSFQ